MFPLRPITLVFGANGSGKSSFIHSLLWLKDTWETGNPDVHQPRSAGTSVDLGGFRQFRFKGETLLPASCLILPISVSKQEVLSR